MKYRQPITQGKTTETVSLSIIHDCISEYFKVPKTSVFYPERKNEIIQPRQWFQYFAHVLNPKLSYAYIGQYYSDRTFRKYDHATVRSSVKKIKGLIDTYPAEKIIKYDLNTLIRSRSIIENIKLSGNCAEQPFKITRYS